jgi:pectate lyase
MQNYPNPFRGSTRIGYELPEAGDVAIKIYNDVGQMVQTISMGHHPPGRHEAEWMPQNLSAGLYFYQLSVDGSIKETRSALLLR